LAFGAKKVAGETALATNVAKLSQLRPIAASKWHLPCRKQPGIGAVSKKGLGTGTALRHGDRRFVTILSKKE
jgi:hypothetical protein